MGTKTVGGAGTGAEAKNDETATEEAAVATSKDPATADTTKVPAEAPAETGAETGSVAPVAAAEPEAEDSAELTEEELAALAEEEQQGSSGVGQGAGAVVSVALGLVSLTGGWIGSVAAARETLIGQLQTSSSASVAKQVKAVYGDAWQTTALWAGLFALAALITGVVVLVRPAFGAPGRAQAPWIKSVAWAGVALGVIGLLLAELNRVLNHLMFLGSYPLELGGIT
ncbi:hypothetical protein ACFWIJ_44905, partial [Streptomyces sp. NPDC127079]|uniref:hypothetical protein n=1 Tax=Streptomyces sp. NPDC127079 TaxID=3347132 RepID=UPI0036680855